MKAWVLHGVNDLRWETVEKPVPRNGEVLVAVKAVGICGSDIPRIYRTGAHRHPLIPGHEFSGIVESLGRDVDSGWLGKRVGIFPLIPCKTCGPCRKGRYEMCRNYNYLGSRRDGGFAEYVAVPVENLIELPDNVSFEEAAMLEPMAVAVHAMRRVLPEKSRAETEPAGNRIVSGQMLPGSSAKPEAALAADGAGREGMTEGTQTESAVFSGSGQRRADTAEKDIAIEKDATTVVCGLGTIGLLLTALFLERGKAGDAGNRILAIGNKDFQKQKVLELGLPAEAYCDSRTCDVGQWILEQTEGRGADVIFECVGRNETVRLAVDSAAPAGRICLVGNPASDMGLEKEVYWKILRNQLTVTGTWNSSFAHDRTDDWHYALELLSRERIGIARLISHRLPLEKLDRGLGIMRDKSEEYVKIMGEMGT